MSLIAWWAGVLVGAAVGHLTGHLFLGLTAGVVGATFSVLERRNNAR